MASLALALMIFVANPSADGSVVLDGTTISESHMRELFDAYQASRTSNRIVINILTKQSPMHWEYGGYHVVNQVINATVWINKSDADAGPAAKHTVLLGVVAGMMLAVMDSGFAGTFWKQFYDTEASLDAALGTPGNPSFAHRGSVAERLAQSIVDQ